MPTETSRIDKEKKRYASGFSVIYSKIQSLKRKHFFNIQNLWATSVSMEHSQGSFQKKNHTLLNGNFVLAGSVACNNRLQTIIFTIFVVLYFGVATEHDSFLK